MQGDSSDVDSDRETVGSDRETVGSDRETLTGLPHGDLGQLLRMDGKVVVVTGAAQRIGREIARTFAGQGASVLVTDIDDAGGERAAAEIRAGGGSASFAHADVARGEDIRAMIDTAVQRYGRL